MSIIVPSRTTSVGLSSNKEQSSHETYALKLDTFAFHTHGNSLYTGEHYRVLSRFLIPPTYPQGNGTANTNDDDFAFTVVHNFSHHKSSRRRETHEWKSYDAIEEQWKDIKDNCIVFLRGYPSQEWLCRLGVQLDIDYEFFYQHFSNPSQLILGENYCLPPLSLISTGTFQMTFTSIGSWDNHVSGMDLTSSRSEFVEEFIAYSKDLNRNQEVRLGDSIVRSFYLYDLKHFSVEQILTIRLLQNDRYWTLLIWTDSGTLLNQSHRGPWLKIQKQHSSDTRILPVPLHHSKIDIKRLLARSTKRQNSSNSNSPAVEQSLAQTLSFLYRDIGDSIDQELAASDPFYALDEVFRLQAASEHQFLNLMEEKAQKQDQNEGNHQRSISEIHGIKKLVDQHRRHLCDMLKTIEARGGSTWQRPTNLEQKQVEKTEQAARQLEQTFKSLIDDAEAVSRICKDEMEMLSNQAVVHEAQKTIDQAEELSKITFIAFIFVPLSFATSLFGMNFVELDDQGHSIWIFFAVAFLVLVFSLVSWWFYSEKRREFRKYLRMRFSWGHKTPEPAPSGLPGPGMGYVAPVP
ncbi:hypothetical protein F5Y02DRAFT_414944 [Annulohypoxylon stygium]|nr:hypothetical protein F5Y02DRAFT_414944 [Annulohypoxylon stygium]